MNGNGKLGVSHLHLPGIRPIALALIFLCSPSSPVYSQSTQAGAHGFFRFVQSSDVLHGIQCLTVSPNGLQIAASFSTKKGTVIGNVDLRTAATTEHPIRQDVHIMTFVNDGNYLVLDPVSSKDSLLCLDAKTLEPIQNASQIQGGFQESTHIEVPIGIVSDFEHFGDVTILDAVHNSTKQISQRDHALGEHIAAFTSGDRLVLSGWLDDHPRTWQIQIRKLSDLTTIRTYTCEPFRDQANRFPPLALHPRLIGHDVLAIVTGKGDWSAVNLSDGAIIQTLGTAQMSDKPPKEEQVFLPRIIDGIEDRSGDLNWLWFSTGPMPGRTQAVIHAQRKGKIISPIPIATSLPMGLASIVETDEGLVLYCAFWADAPMPADTVSVVAVNLDTGKIGAERKYKGNKHDWWLMSKASLIQGTDQGIRITQLDN